MGDGWGHSPQAVLLLSTPYNLSKRVCMCTTYTHCGKFMVGLFSAIRLPLETDATAAVDAICLLLSPLQLLGGVFKFCIFCGLYFVFFHCSIASKVSGIVPTQLIGEILTFCILYFSFLILIKQLQLSQSLWYCPCPDVGRILVFVYFSVLYI